MNSDCYSKITKLFNINKEKTRCRGLKVDNCYITTCDVKNEKNKYFCPEHCKVYTILKNKKNKKDECCCICYDDTKKQYSQIPCCKAYFCKECIEKWHFMSDTLKNGSYSYSSCPMCRRNIFSVDRRYYEKNNILFIASRDN